MVIILCVVSLEVNNTNIMYATAASEESSSNDIFLSSSSILLDSLMHYGLKQFSRCYALCYRLSNYIIEATTSKINRGKQADIMRHPCSA